MLTHQTVAADFFKEHLSKSLQKQLQWDTLAVEKGTFIDEQLRASTCDILYSIKINKDDAYLYCLLEHQSTPDPMMALRMLKYTLSIMEYHWKKQEKLSKKKPLPLVIPLVFYAGKRKYPYSTDVRDLIRAPEKLIQQYFLKPFKLMDLSQMDDKISLRHMYAGLMEVAMGYRITRAIRAQDKRLMMFIQAVDDAGRFDLAEFTLQYLLTTTDRDKPKQFFEYITESAEPETRTKIMNMAERLQKQARQEGVKQGIEKGVQKGLQKGIKQGIEQGVEKEKEASAIRMLKAGTEVDFISDITKLSSDKIKALKESMND